AAGLYALADLSVDHGGLSDWLRSEAAVRILEAACRAPGAPRAVHTARVTDLLAVSERLERALRPLTLDWYGMDGDKPGADAGLASAQLCHAVGGGPAALPGLLTRHFYGTPLLITEYGSRLREHYLISAAHAVAPSAPSAPVRALLASFQVRLAREAYASAALITPGNTHTRRWQERCGADRERLRTVYPGMDARPFHALGETGGRAAAVRRVPAGRVAAGRPDGQGVHGRGPADEGRRVGALGLEAAAADRREARPAGERGRVDQERADQERADQEPTLVWVGRIEPSKDLVGLLHAFAEVRRSVASARLRIVSTPQRGRPDPAYLAHCRGLAAQLFPDEAPDRHAEGDNPVLFGEVGDPDVPTVASAYASASVAVLSSVVEGFPVPLVESMFCALPTVSTDVGAVCEVIGGTGLVVPPRNPRALADACVALLRDPERRERLGSAARARALELFTVEQNLAAFRSIYLELISA
ncbi:glycosyltransferase, partial [Streptomyces sp. SM14]|uniref:glycosyltransferase n=1 Tax=Streptomyces sp. SM14 TaxID=1736045 RepID=UPI000CD4BA93